MKKITSLAILLFVSFCSVFAQVPSAFNYQAVVRNTLGELVPNQNISFRISILEDSESGSAVYSETHTATTNNFGLVNLKVGQGTVDSGTFSPGSWGTTSHFIKIELDTDGGSAYTHMGTSQLLSVPYAFHAQTVEIDNVNDADADATNELQTISLSGTSLTLSDGGGTVTLPSSGGGDNWGTQTVVSDATLKGNGTAASPLNVIGDLTDNQTLSLSGYDLSITGGNAVTLPISPWIIGAEVYYRGDKDLVIGESGESAKTKSVEIQIPPKLFIETADKSSLKLYNNSTNQPGLYVFNNSGQAAQFYGNSATSASADFTNNGTGPAALFNDQIKISDGTQGAGKVLTSDANGLASWQTPATSGWTVSGNSVYKLSGTVAIGSMPNIYALMYANSETNVTSVAAINNGSFATIEAKNNGSGVAARFANEIQIIDGTEGKGKVLTSDETGKTSWQTSLSPIAYGYVTSTGSLSSGTSNVSVNKGSTGNYEITISGLSTIDYIVTATTNGGTAFILSSVYRMALGSAYNFRVVTWDTKNDAYSDSGFSFVVYKP